MPYPRVDTPPLYLWEISSTSNHTRYDYPKAWPAEDQLRLEFILLATVNAVVSFFVFFLIVALLRSKRVYRASPFHRYLLYIAIPDFLVSFFCLITCFLSAHDSQYYSEWMCGWQSFYLNFAFIANAWLNGIIVYQIHTMLRYSNRRRRYKPPTERTITMHSLAVYAYALCWGLLCGFNLPFLPHSSHLYYGFACMPMEYSTASTVFFWAVYIPLSLGLPLIFAAYVVFDILYRGLLPPTGRRRQLSMFLLRLCCLYFAIWFPFLVLISTGNFVRISPLVHWIGALLSHLQGMLSALFCLTNKAIYNAFYLTLTCQPIDREEHYESDLIGRGSNGSSEFIRSSFFSSLQNRWGSTKRTLSQSQQQPTSSVIMELADISGVDKSAISAMGPQDSSMDPEEELRQLQDEQAQPPDASGGEDNKSDNNKNDVDVEGSRDNEQEYFKDDAEVSKHGVDEFKDTN